MNNGFFTFLILCTMIDFSTPPYLIALRVERAATPWRPAVPLRPAYLGVLRQKFLIQRTRSCHCRESTALRFAMAISVRNEPKLGPSRRGTRENIGARPACQNRSHSAQRWVSRRRTGGLRETGAPSKTAGNEMTYRISYDDGLAREAVKRSEYYRTEFEAMRRARQLLEDGDHHGIALHDASGSVLTGIRLELKLGMAVTE